MYTPDYRLTTSQALNTEQKEAIEVAFHDPTVSHQSSHRKTTVSSGSGRASNAAPVTVLIRFLNMNVPGITFFFAWRSAGSRGKLQKRTYPCFCQSCLKGEEDKCHNTPYAGLSLTMYVIGSASALGAPFRDVWGPTQGPRRPYPEAGTSLHLLPRWLDP